MLDNDPEIKKWLDHMAKDSGKKIEESSLFTGVLSEKSLMSPQVAIQIGYAVLLDKPIMLIVENGMKVPTHLTKIARAIERVRTGNKEDMNRAYETLTNLMKGFNDEAEAKQ